MARKKPYDSNEIMFELCYQAEEGCKTYFETKNNGEESFEESSSDQGYFEQNPVNAENPLADESSEEPDLVDF